MADARGLEQPVDRGRADGQEWRPHGRGQHAGDLFVMIEPMRPRRLEQFAAHLIAQKPERLERRPQHDGLVAGFGARPLSGRPVERPVQEPQGGLAVVATVEAERLQDAGLVGTTGRVESGRGFSPDTRVWRTNS